MGFLHPVQYRFAELKRARIKHICESGTQKVEEFDPAWAIVDPSTTSWFPSQNQNRIIDFALVEESPDSRLSEIMDVLAKYGLPRYFAYLDPSTNFEPLAKALWIKGFRLGNSLSVLTRELREETVATGELEIRVAGEGSVLDLEAVLSYEGTQEVMWRASTIGMIGQTDSAVVIAYRDGRPVATGAVTVHGGVAYLSNATTVPSYRGHGAQREVIAARLMVAQKRGCDLAFVETYPWANSYRNLVSCGFTNLYQRLIFRYEVDPVLRASLKDTIEGHPEPD